MPDTSYYATYFGKGTNGNECYSLAHDKFGNTFVSGSTGSTSGIATMGAYQTSIGGYGDAFLAKFNCAGGLEWATYFGGPSDDEGDALATDDSGNVFMTGWTTSKTGIATSGAYQTSFLAYPSRSNIFIAKFNTGGSLQWATYYGGKGGEVPYGIVTDKAGTIYLSGATQSTSGITTSGAYQTSLTGGPGGVDAFIAKFSGGGSLLRGTYFGNTDAAYGVALDSSGNVLIAGRFGDTGIATSGAYQTYYAGNGDGFLAKFDTSLTTLKWGTYYGGNQSDYTFCVASDGANAYITGFTMSDSNIATSGAFQTSFGGGTNSGDAFLAKFDSSGTMQWSTYYGGSGEEQGNGIKVDSYGNIYLAGTTSSDSGIATNGSLQPSLKGAGDVFLAKFSATGTREYATYFGTNTASANFSNLSADNYGNAYVAGSTSNGSIVASNNAYQTSFTGTGYDVFFAKILSAPVSPCLSGYYTIGASGADFPTFNSAVAALDSFGVCGPVVFNVADGVYKEHVVVQAINGSSTTNTITFQSANGDSSKVIITDTTDNLWEFSGNASYITLKRMTFTSIGSSGYSNVISFVNSSTNQIRILNNQIFGQSGSNSADISIGLDSNVTIKDNLIKSNFVGISQSCKLNSMPAGLIIQGNRIDSCLFYGITLYEVSGPQIISNNITRCEYGINLSVCNGSYMVLKNKVYSYYTSFHDIISESVGSGFGHSVIANNFFGSCDTLYATAGMYFQDVSYQNIYFNNVIGHGYTPKHSSPAIFMLNDSGTGKIYTSNNIRNNNFVSDYAAAFVNNDTLNQFIDTMDYNNLYNKTGTVLAVWDSISCSSLAKLQSVSGKNVHSINVDPGYINNPLNLRATSNSIKGQGLAISGISTDIDGNTRTNPPAIGANEVNKVVTSCLSGAYTIGGVTGDFSTFAAAATALNKFGVCGPVVFTIADGTYKEQVIIDSVRGTSATNTITFQSQSKDSSKVILSYPSSSDSTKLNAVLFLDTAKNIHFKYLTFTRTGKNKYARVIYFWHQALNDSFYHCQFLGNQYRNGANELFYLRCGHTTTGGYITYQQKISVSISNSLLLYGSYAFYADSSAGYSSLQNNIIKNQSKVPVHLWADQNTLISGNSITGFYTCGIYLGWYSYHCQILNNRITGEGEGIYTYGDYDTLAIINNMISIQGRDTYNNGNIISCIDMEFTQGSKVYYNNLYAKDSASYGLYMKEATIMSFVNNCIFADNKSIPICYSPYIISGGYPNSYIDYNNYYTAGSIFGDCEAHNYSDLSSWRAGTKFDSHSLFFNPDYVTTTNLRATKGYLSGNGKTLPGILKDIFGKTRPNPPTIGANEITLANEAALSPVLYQPDTICAGTKAVYVNLENKGTDSLLSDSIFWEVNGVSNAAIRWTGNLKTGHSVSVNLGTNNFHPGMNTIKAWSMQPNGVTDSFPKNDMIVVSVIVDSLAVANAGSNSSICSGHSFAIGATGTHSYKYSWTSKPSGFTSSNSNPLVFPTQTTTYYLAVTTFCGTTVDSAIITVSPKPDAAFNKSIGVKTVKFSPGDTTLSSYSWSFGDSATSSSLKPTHTYSKSGSYTVQLTVKNSYGCVNTGLSYIHISSSSATAFFYSPDTNCTYTSILFSDSSKSDSCGIINKWNWSFGDGGTDTVQNPSHTYSAPGIYSVALKISSSGGCTDSFSKKIFIDSTCVWPGDANDNKLVEISDFLNIGIAYGDSGAKRPTVPNIFWKGQYCDNWGKKFLAGTNYKHADCNGDGVVDSIDVMAINTNWGNIHKKSGPMLTGSPADPAFFIMFSKNHYSPGDTAIGDIILGSSSVPFAKAYGMAYGFTFDPHYVDTTTLKIQFKSSWFGTPGRNMISLVHHDYANDLLYFGISRTDHKNVSGNGKVGTLSFVIPSAAVRGMSYFQPVAGKTISFNEIGIPTYLPNDTFIWQTLTGVQTIENTVNDIKLYPNPAACTLTIDAGKNTIQSIVITDMTGKEVYRDVYGSALNSQVPFRGFKGSIPVSNFTAGIYIVKIGLDNGSYIAKFMKQ